VKWEVWLVREMISDFLVEIGPRTIWEVIQYFTSGGYSIPEQTVIRALWCMDTNGELELCEGGLMAADKKWVDAPDQPDLFRR
jgi:hypothetical protein